MNWSMISSRLVDEMRLTLAPFIIGGSQATTLVDGEGVSKINRAINFTPVSIIRQGREIVLTVRVR